MSFSDSKQPLPEGFAMGLAQSPKAMDAYGRLPGSEKAHYVERAHQVSSKAEMRALIDELGNIHTL